MKATQLCMLALVACGGTDASPEAGDITVTITSPSPGDELLESESPAIRVTGSIATTSPAFGTLEAWVNGERVQLASDNTFSVEVAPDIGVNHIKVQGGDGITALVGQELDVMWAPAYLAPIAGTTGFDIPGGIRLQLGQRFFDARTFGTELDLSTNPVVARDLASALELILWHVDLASLLGGALQFGSGNASLSVTIPSATPGAIITDARVVDDPVKAIDLSIDLNGVFLEMDGTFAFGNRTLIIDGGITADLHASARLTLGLAEDGTIEVTVSQISAQVGPLVPAFTGDDGDELDAFITIGNSDFRRLIEGLIESELIPTFTDKVPPLLETLLGATDSLLDNLEFTLDPGLGVPVTLQLDGSIGALDVEAGPAIGTLPGHVSVIQDLTVRTTSEPVHASSRGAARLEAQPAAPNTLTAGVHLVMRQEFLNGLLHSLWNSGLLEGEAVFGGLTAKVSAKLAPVVRPTPPSSDCKIDGVRCDVILQLGQIEVGIADFEQSFGVNAQAGARIVVEGTKVSLKIQELPELIVWETSTEHGVLTPEVVRDLIATLVWPELFGAIGDNLSIELPLPDLAALGLDTLGPGLADAELLLEMRQRPDVTGGFLTLGADLELATPQP
ncbi:MAG: hypothetical protein H0V17_05445 [Deltaproteobacteria bacterium]|nr:hypothetical protein [Deltaproteobacteria bacterium]